MSGPRPGARGSTSGTCAAPRSSPPSRPGCSTALRSNGIQLESTGRDPALADGRRPHPASTATLPKPVELAQREKPSVTWQSTNTTYPDASLNLTPRWVRRCMPCMQCKHLNIASHASEQMNATVATATQTRLSPSHFVRVLHREPAIEALATRGELGPRAAAEYSIV